VPRSYRGALYYYRVKNIIFDYFRVTEWERTDTWQTNVSFEELQVRACAERHTVPLTFSWLAYCN